MDWKSLHKSEKFGVTSFGIEIKVAATKLPDLETFPIWSAVNRATGIVEAAIREAINAEDPKTAIATDKNRSLVKIFPTPIYIEEIPNGYCKDWCCTHLPWFVVTTKVGRITIGWRKRVIQIGWEGTDGTANAKELFKAEDVTKGDKYIHAWSLEDATRYVEAIISSAGNSR